MNRNFPPPSPPMRFPHQDNMNAYAPARLVMALIGQSERRYRFHQEAVMKLDAGLGDLALAFEGQQLDPAIGQHLGILFAKGEAGKLRLENEMKGELDWQDELKRFLMGRGPRTSMRRPPQLTQGAPPGYQPQYPAQQPGYPQQAGYPQHPQQPPQSGGYPQQYAQPQQPPREPVPPEMMAAPQGPIDYRDPKQAAAALLRAQPMPLGPMSNQPNQPQQGPGYVPPGAYGMAPGQAAYGIPPGQYVPPPSQVPVVQGSPETATLGHAVSGPGPLEQSRQGQVIQQTQSQQPTASVIAAAQAQSNGAAKNAAS